MNKYKIIRIIMYVVFLCAFCRWGYTELLYKDGELSYTELRENVLQAAENNDKDTTAFHKENGADGSEPLLKIDHLGLAEMNMDYVCWLSACDDKISYPVVKGRNNDEYLHKTFFGDKSFVGSLFMDSRCGSDMQDFQTVIYGHSMKDGSMFRQLVPYTGKEYVGKYPYFYIYTKNGDVYKYEIFSVCLEDSDQVIPVFGTPSEEEKGQILEKLKGNSLYNIGNPKEADNIVSLVTCDVHDENKRVVVSGMRVDNMQN